MQFNFVDILNALNQNLSGGDNFAWAYARQAATPGDYLLNSILPDENRPNYNVSGGSLTITPTMLQGVPMDTPFAPFGSVSASQFFENTTKVGGALFFTERQQRELQDWVTSIIATGATMGRNLSEVYGTLDVNPETGFASNDTVNGRRLNAVLGLARTIQVAHWDTREYLKGKALAYGEIQSGDFAFAGNDLVVDYGVPAGNKFTARTGNDAYGGSTSKFWTDVRALARYMTNIRLIMNSNTYYAIVDNSVNQLIVTDEAAVNNYGATYRVRKYDQTKTSPAIIDKRDTVTLITYNRAGSVIKNDVKNGASLQSVQFIPDGKIIAVGDLNTSEFMIDNAILDPEMTYRLGYNHIAPTVEGQNVPGVWSRIYTPEGKPWSLLAETASNFLPVITAPKRLYILTTSV